MIAAFKAFVRSHWPRLRLRAILFLALLFVAALPGFAAISLRVYENTLVRQTEAELVAQGAALAAAAEAMWPGGPPGSGAPLRPEEYRPEALSLDLSATPVLPERPAGAPAFPARSDAVAAARVLAPVIVDTGRTTLASIVLTDAQGVVVRGAEARRSYAALPEVRRALAGRPATVLRRNGEYRPRYSFEWLSRASALRIHHARPVIVGGEVRGVLLLSRSPRALFRGIYEDRGKIMLGVGAIFALLVLMSGLISRGVTRPIEALSAASRQVAAGQGRVPPTPPTAAVEIQDLYEDFRAMADAIERRSHYLRDFAAAVSHEFKTPLAGIRGAVELLEDHHAGMTEEERLRFLANIDADSARLSQLVTRLLDLARADMTDPGRDARSDPAGVARRVADAFANDAFAVELSGAESWPAVAVPEPSLEAALNALVENSRQAGARRVVIAGRVARGVLTLSVTDDGPGVAPGDRDRLFEPFFTGRRAEGGTGLGLSIALSLLAASHGEIAHAASPTGARFDVRLPLG